MYHIICIILSVSYILISVQKVVFIKIKIVLVIPKEREKLQMCMYLKIQSNTIIDRLYFIRSNACYMSIIHINTLGIVL